MKINFSLNSETQIYKETIRNLFKIALQELGTTKRVSVNVVLVDAEEIKQMNNKYRNVNKVTDVLSFPMVNNIKEIESEQDFNFGNVNIGDIYINLERAKEQALFFGHSLKREFCFLALHGFLHLLGFDHIEKDEEKQMFDFQNTILNIAKLERD